MEDGAKFSSRAHPRRGLTKMDRLPFPIQIRGMVVKKTMCTVEYIPYVTVPRISFIDQHFSLNKYAGLDMVD